MVLSDLHLLAKRSVGESLFADLSTRMDDREILVLNGDTFDFRWSRVQPQSAAVSAAVKWIEALTDRFEGREVHFIYGNHDCLGAFREVFEPMADSLPPLQIHEFFLCLGDQLFLHGDCANRKMDASDLRAFREAWSYDKPRKRFYESLYELADVSGLSRLFHRCYFQRLPTIRRVAFYLDRALPDWRTNVNDCYFGHTHLPFRDQIHQSVRFHNTGSGIRGMGFQPMEFEFAIEDTDTKTTVPK